MYQRERERATARYLRESKQAEWEGRVWFGKRKVWAVRETIESPERKNAGHRYIHIDKKRAEAATPN